MSFYKIIAESKIKESQYGFSIKNYCKRKIKNIIQFVDIKKAKIFIHPFSNSQKITFIKSNPDFIILDNQILWDKSTNTLHLTNGHHYSEVVSWQNVFCYNGVPIENQVIPTKASCKFAIEKDYTSLLKQISEFSFNHLIFGFLNNLELKKMEHQLIEASGMRAVFLPNDKQNIVLVNLSDVISESISVFLKVLLKETHPKTIAFLGTAGTLDINTLPLGSLFKPVTAYTSELNESEKLMQLVDVDENEGNIVSVDSLFKETIEVCQDWSAKGILAVEQEGYYLGRSISKLNFKGDVYFQLLITDCPLSETQTINHLPLRDILYRKYFQTLVREITQ